jgi:hypothetical protein
VNATRSFTEGGLSRPARDPIEAGATAASWSTGDLEDGRRPPVNVASALLSIVLMSVPKPGSAGAGTWIQAPPGWTAIAPKRHTASRRAWHRGDQILGMDVHPNHDSLRDIVNRVFLPASTTGMTRVASSAATTVCNGRQPAWRIVLTAPLEPGRHAVFEEIVAVDGRFSYVMSYMRRSTEAARPEAERAMRSLCLKRS